MKKLALGIVAAAAVFTAVPAFAQFGVYVGPGGAGVGVGPSYGYYDDGWRHPGWRRGHRYGAYRNRYYSEYAPRYRYRYWDD